METYETTVFDQFNKQTSPISGKKIFTIPFSTRQLGTVELPPIILTSFNPGSGKYETTSTAPLLINVEPAVKKSNKWVSSVIPAIKAPSSKPWLAGVVIFCVAFVAVTTIYYYNKRKTIAGIKPFPVTDVKQSLPVAEPEPEPVQILQLPPGVSVMIEDSKAQDFYKEIENVLRKLLEEKFNIDRKAGIMSIERSLANSGVANSDVDAIKELLEDCALSKYTPFVLEDKMKTDFATCRDLLIRLQQPLVSNL